MNKKLNSKQRGIGLVEVLVALVVVSLGLLGLAKLEGNLLSTSGNNKARAEAMGIAQQQMETIRYAASSDTSYQELNDGFPPSLVDLDPFSVTGTNAQFTVDIDIDDPDANQIINTIVAVAWTDATGAPDSVTLMSEIALQDVQKSAFNTNDSAASTAVPSPRQSASEDVQAASETVDPNDVISPTDTPLPATGNVDVVAGVLDSEFEVISTVDGTTSYLLTAIEAGSRYYNTYFGDGVLGVYVCDGVETAGQVECRYIQNHFGGVSLSTSGTIYSAKNYGAGSAANDNDLSGISPVWSSSEVTACYKGPITPSVDLEGDDVFAMPYECVYAGNCEDNAASCYGFGTATAVTPAQVEAKGVGPGGEFGNLGLIGLDGSAGGDQVCFLEDTPDITVDADGEALLNGNNQDGGGNPPQYNEAYLLPVTTRAYVTRRLLSNGEERSEGINQSFRNHNFLLVNRANNEDEDNCYLAVNQDADTLEDYVLAPRTIARVRFDTGADVENPVQPTSTFPANSMPGITVSSSVSGNRPNLYIPELGSCYVKADNSTYACVIPNTYTTNVMIYGKSSNVPATTTGADDPPVPAVYESCTFDVDLTEIGNIDSPAATPSFDCRWSIDF